MSTPALATTMAFSDDPIVPKQTLIRRAHLLELRTAVSAVRAAAGLAAPSWSDPSIVAGMTPIRATHVHELRTNLNAALTALGIPLPGFTWTIATGGVIHADDVKELRNAVR